jgi:dTDP-4-dehydrorhamnose reductase
MNKKLKIFLTGSSSFLGSKFIEMYADEFDIFGIALHSKENPLDILDKQKLKEAYLKFNPDVIVHLAAIVDNDASKVREPNIQGTKNIIEIAYIQNTPLVYLSSESVYGGREQSGNYIEADEYKPRSIYGETKVQSEKLIISSGLNYLILRAHRFVGICRSFDNPKQFPDTIRAIVNNQTVHLDAVKLFKPCLINHINQIIKYYIQNDLDNKIIINVGVDKAVTYYEFILDVVNVLGLNKNLVKSDGEEKGWPHNSTLCLDLLNKSDYPKITYKNLLEVLKKD